MSVYRIAQILGVEDVYVAGLQEMISRGLIKLEEGESGLWYPTATKKGLKLIADVKKVVERTEK